MKKFYDTCALLELGAEVFDDFFYLSSVTIQELENIKTSAKKDNEVKFQARQMLRLLMEGEDLYSVWPHTTDEDEEIIKMKLDLTNDNKIIIDFLQVQKKQELEFVTNDLACYMIAKTIFGITDITNACCKFDNYCGYKDLRTSEGLLANFYTFPKENIYELLENEYLILRNESGECVGTYVWRNGEYTPVVPRSFESAYMEKIVPINHDLPQILAMESMSTNKLTLVKGKAGSGKSLLSLGYLFKCLDKKRIDKIIIFCNTVATMGSAKLGYLPGTRTEKLLDSQIGNFLLSKIGGRVEIERMIAEEKLVILPVSDIRGFDTTDMRAGVYITEAQNLDINLMKLALQRLGDDCTMIIDGDVDAQVDDSRFAGRNNGMRRVSEIFRGSPFYGEVQLTKIYRGEIAEMADKM